MINFSSVKEFQIPEGRVLEIKKGDTILWSQRSDFNYVSLGDSIAAGYLITDEWPKVPFDPELGRYEGTGCEYGNTLSVNSTPNSSTIIVKNSYTDLLGSYLSNIHGANKVSNKSFANSGQTVAGLIRKLSDSNIVNAIKKANIVTLCIGANDILGAVNDDSLGEYIQTGSLANIENEVVANLNRLNNDSDSNSYIALFNKLNSINPNAKFVFTTVYNPYKFLWLDDGPNGFFAPLLQNWIPDMSFSILGMTFDIKSYIQQYLLDQAIVRQLFSRINGLDAWVETYVTRLNDILKSKVASYSNSNFMVADTKLLFDSFPDTPVSASKHYCDLVNVEFTRGIDYAAMDWGALWRDDYGDDYGAYWWDLADRYIVDRIEGGTYNPADWDWEGFAAELVNDTIEKVIRPNIDPHPETYGQYLLSRSFKDALGWESLDKYSITLKPNGASGSDVIKNVVCVDGLPVYLNIPALPYSAPSEGKTYNSWNTSSTGSGTKYTNQQFIALTSNLTLYAQWNTKYLTLTFKHQKGDVIETQSSGTGPMESYALWIDGTEQSDLGAFSNGARTYSLAYGTPVGCVAAVKEGDARSYITFNGTKVAGNSSSAGYTFNITKDTTCLFEWNQWYAEGSGWLPIPELQSYWNCYITTS